MLSSLPRKAQIDMNLYQRNLQLLNHFQNTTKEQLKKHIEMSGPKIGQLNKFS